MPSTDTKPHELFDMTAALKRLGGSRELLGEMFQFFVEDAPPLVDHLESSLRQRQTDEAYRAAHSLKGLAANFDALAVIKLAKQMEEWIRQRDYEQVESHIPEMRRNIDACIKTGRELLQRG